MADEDPSTIPCPGCDGTGWDPKCLDGSLPARTCWCCEGTGEFRPRTKRTLLSRLACWAGYHDWIGMSVPHTYGCARPGCYAVTGDAGP